MLSVRDLLTLADAYRGTVPVEDKTLSFRIFGDSKKLAALRGESDITVGRFNDAMLWFSANWPEGLAWPEGVARPEPMAPADAVEQQGAAA